MTDEKPQEKVERSRLQLLAVLSAGAAGSGCTIAGDSRIGDDKQSGPRPPQQPQDFGGGDGGGGGGGGGGGSGGGGH